MKEVMAGLATQLAALIGNETVTAVNSKIAAMKTEKDIGKVKQNYENILNGLLNERAEALRIAQAYRDELEKVEISDEDIEHLHNTVERLIEIIKNFLIKQNNGEDNQEIQEQISSFEQIKELISVDTLKTMQLLGFNYKQAIGDPLTMILRNFILSKVPTSDNTEVIHKMITPEMVEILKNKNAYDNFKELIGNPEN
ncbi:hypothetical protein BHU41_00585 [Lactobacillus crispatus]|uniref:Uncharacterized protein n=1 Tax=Lactobacillus crispatus TaxID=47770 RepID=A0A2M9WN73_9LACO|nr:hypothetical protein [Lactobacillus crispatus]MDK6666096.1 hypothetical protein [Lactobacillus crispatus]MDK8613040.1 hypothetical protein [Lactobacillus crispatus]MDT9610690.1 hypothetical protein [Lactobacillus crispatus]MDT9618253.1 hypothetical protein [Lactobacillus crispatus]PJZ16875.1 hypothetical protein BHU41_00585 [Lactobacillus crispatus]